MIQNQFYPKNTFINHLPVPSHSQKAKKKNFILFYFHTNYDFMTLIKKNHFFRNLFINKLDDSEMKFFKDVPLEILIRIKNFVQQING